MPPIELKWAGGVAENARSGFVERGIRALSIFANGSETVKNIKKNYEYLRLERKDQPEDLNWLCMKYGR